MNREPNFDDLVGTETRGAERERLRGAHELLLRAGPPAELPPQLRKAPSVDVVRLKPRRTVKRTSIEISMPVPRISPSPWWAWPSPRENSAPGAKTGK